MAVTQLLHCLHKEKKTFVRTLDIFQFQSNESNISTRKLLCPNIVWTGIRLLLVIYNATKSKINHLSYIQFVKSTLDKPLQLSSLSLTSAAAYQHLNRVYYQIQSNWMLQNKLLESITTIFCNCGCRYTELHVFYRVVSVTASMFYCIKAILIKKVHLTPKSLTIYRQISLNTKMLIMNLKLWGQPEYNDDE